MSRKSLAADIDDLLNVAPRDYDPDDEPGYDAASRLSYQDDAHADDDAPVDIPDGRLRLKGGLHDSFDPEDPKSAYAGRRASRRDLDSDEEEEELEEGEEEADHEESDEGSDEDDGDDDDDDGDDDDEQEEDDEEEEGSGEQSESSEGSEDGSGSEDGQESGGEEDAPALLSSSFAQARRRDSASGGAAATAGGEADDATRGTHVKTQKQLWDSLLTLRMRLQPAMESARQLPRPTTQVRSERNKR
jgi:protein AATF/BFR2